MLTLDLDSILAEADLESGVPVRTVAARYPQAMVTAMIETHGQKPPRWTQAEVEQVRQWLGVLPYSEIGARLGRSADGVKIVQTRRELNAPSRQSGWLTANQVAMLLGTDVHQVCAWTDRGLLPYRLVPGRRRIRAIRYVTLRRWAVNPLNWIYFKRSVDDMRRILDPHLRRLIERQKERWNDAWWSPTEVADFHGVDHTDVNRLIRRGEIRGVKWGNWWVLRSEATKPELKFYKGKGSAAKRLPDLWNPQADAFLRRCREQGVTWEAISRMMKMKQTRLRHRYECLKKQDAGVRHDETQEATGQP